MLNIKPNQNWSLAMNSSRYTEGLKPLIECLSYSPLYQALNLGEYVPLVHLPKAYSSTNHNPNDRVITFDIESYKTSISKTQFSSMLGLTSTEVPVDPKSISSTATIKMLFQMGYLGEITLLSKFKKPNLLPMWNGLFSLLFKIYSEWVTGSNSASKLLCTIIYGLYTRINLDYG